MPSRCLQVGFAIVTAPRKLPRHAIRRCASLTMDVAGCGKGKFMIERCDDMLFYRLVLYTVSISYPKGKCRTPHLFFPSALENRFRSRFNKHCVMKKQELVDIKQLHKFTEPRLNCFLDSTFTNSFSTSPTYENRSVSRCC